MTPARMAAGLAAEGHADLADILPGIFTYAARLCGPRVQHREDAVMAGVEGAVRARARSPGAPRGYLVVAARRAMVDDARAMLWNRFRRSQDAPGESSLDEESPAAEDPVTCGGYSGDRWAGAARVEASAELATALPRAPAAAWEAAALTWGAGLALRDASLALGLSGHHAAVCQRRALVVDALRERRSRHEFAARATI